LIELGYTQAVNVKLVEKTNDNRAGHYGEDNNIYLNDAKIIHSCQHRFHYLFYLRRSVGWCWRWY
jgi:hypothetical protein